MEIQPAIILLSILVAFIGAYTTINLYEQFRLMSKENQPKLLSPNLALFLMACSLGGVSIWTMHFVAMSSVTMTSPIDGSKLEVTYRIDYTLISLVVVVLLAWAGLVLGSHDKAFTKDKNDASKFLVGILSVISRVFSYRYHQLIPPPTSFRAPTLQSTSSSRMLDLSALQRFEKFATSRSSCSQPCSTGWKSW